MIVSVGRAGIVHDLKTESPVSIVRQESNVQSSGVRFSGLDTFSSSKTAYTGFKIRGTGKIASPIVRQAAVSLAKSLGIPPNRMADIEFIPEAEWKKRYAASTDAFALYDDKVKIRTGPNSTAESELQSLQHELYHHNAATLLKSLDKKRLIPLVNTAFEQILRKNLPLYVPKRDVLNSIVGYTPVPFKSAEQANRFADAFKAFASQFQGERIAGSYEDSPEYGRMFHIAWEQADYDDARSFMSGLMAIYLKFRNDTVPSRPFGFMLGKRTRPEADLPSPDVLQKLITNHIHLAFVPRPDFRKENEFYFYYFAPEEVQVKITESRLFRDLYDKALEAQQKNSLPLPSSVLRTLKYYSEVEKERVENLKLGETLLFNGGLECDASRLMDLERQDFTELESVEFMNHLVRFYLSTPSEQEATIRKKSQELAQAKGGNRNVEIAMHEETLALYKFLGRLRALYPEPDLLLPDPA